MDNPLIAYYATLLKSEYSSVRSYAARELRTLGDASAVPALVEALKDEHNWVCDSAAKALGTIGVSAIPTLIEVLKDDDHSTRSMRIFAARALGKLETPLRFLFSSERRKTRATTFAVLRRTH